MTGKRSDEGAMMNDTPGWASPGSSPSGEPDPESGPGTPQDSAPPATSPNWSKQQPPPGQWSAPGTATPPPVPPPPTGPGWGQQPGQQPGWQQGWQHPQHWGSPPSPKPGIIPLRPLGVGEILDGAVSTMRAHWRTVLGISLVVALATETIMVLLQGFAGNQGSSSLGSNPTFSDFMHAMGGVLVLDGLGLLITLLGTVIATAMLTMVISRAVLARPVTTRDAWSDSRPQLLRLLGLTALIGLIAFGIVAVGILPGVLVIIAASTGWGIALVAVGGLAAAAATLWLVIRFSLASPALMLEKQGVFKAMARSAKLVRGSWWRMFGIQLLAGFIVFMVSGVIQTPFAVIAGLTADGGMSGLLSADSGGFGWTSLIIIGIGSVIASTITFPISAGVTALLYMDQRIRREALDIELARAAGVPGYADSPADSTTTGS
jgi:hypothetical protein